MMVEVQNQLIKDSEITIKKAIEVLGIDNSRKHLEEYEFIRILNMLSNNVENKDIFMKFNLKGYRLTIERFKSIEDWEKANHKDRIIVNRHIYSNNKYFHIMIISKRLKIDWQTIKSDYLIPDIIQEDDKKLILQAATNLKYSKSTIQNILNNLKRLMLITGKNLNQITSEDIIEYRFKSNRRDGIQAIFYTLKSLGYIDSKEQYKYNPNRISKKIQLKSSQGEIKKVFDDFKEYSQKNFYCQTAINQERIAIKFLNWLIDEYSGVIEYNKINRNHIEDFVISMKNSINENTGHKYAESTINGQLSHLKNGLFKYLKIRKLLNKETEVFIFSYKEEYSEFYYKENFKFPKPINLEDRKKIEYIIYELKKEKNTMYSDLLVLLYQLAIRPSELLSLKLNCIKGNTELPQVFVHRAKHFKQRYIPLTNECYEIMKKYQMENRYSPSVYLSYDGEASQRLFNFQGVVPSIQSLEEYFSKLLIDNGIVDVDDKPKYTLYVLKRLRITIWLESGMSEITVAKLVGHSNVDSHNAYIISKEAKNNNAKKVYEQFYKEFFDEISKHEKYIETQEDLNDTDDYIEQIKKELIQIQEKNINSVALSQIFNEFPEYALPVPCGYCLAKAFENDFECEMMKLPCLECEKLLDKGLEIKKFDELVSRIYKNRESQIKKNIVGLVIKSDNMISRLKKFYIVKFKKNEKEVEEIFNNIKKMSIIKRGRKKREKGEANGKRKIG